MTCYENGSNPTCPVHAFTILFLELPAAEINGIEIEVKLIPLFLLPVEQNKKCPERSIYSGQCSGYVPSSAQLVRGRHRWRMIDLSSADPPSLRNFLVCVSTYLGLNIGVFC